MSTCPLFCVQEIDVGRLVRIAKTLGPDSIIGAEDQDRRGG